MEIRSETGNKKRFLPLLLIGDEQEEMIDRYLPAGNLYVGSVAGRDIAVCVTSQNEDGTLEINNIAVLPSFQGKGYGKEMMRWIEKQYPGRIIRLGTGETPSTLNFYKACGFSFSHRITDFFTEHYDHEIREEGIVLKDMICFQKDTAIREVTDSGQWPELLSIWEAAVRDSHHFLSEEDIAFFRTKIPAEYLPYLTVFGIADEQNALCGFLALSDTMIEMLFVHPSAKGRGYGTRLLRYATDAKGMRQVDVNEQNPQALRFYQSRGFKITGREATDPSGKPFPILHMSL